MDDPQLGTTLLGLLRRDADTTRRERARSLSAGEWAELAERACAWQLAPTLYHRLKHLGGGDVPEPIIRQLRAAALQAAAGNATAYHRLAPILAGLHRADIPAIALKGIYLAEHVYTHAGERTFADADILVHEGDLFTGRAILEQLGYVPRTGQAVTNEYAHTMGFEHPETGLHVELHRGLSNAQYAFRVDLDALWSRAQRTTVAGVPMLRLSPEDVLAYLCLHGAQHALDHGPRMILDVAEVIGRFVGALDWDLYVARIEAWRTNKSAYLMLAFARDYLGASVPADVLARLQPARLDEHWVAVARAQVLGQTVTRTQRFVRLWGSDSLSRRAGILVTALLPPRLIMARMYPPPANSPAILLYYPVRWARLIRLYGRKVWRLWRGDPAAQDEANRRSPVLGLQEWLTSG